MLLNLDLRTIPPQTNLEPVPESWYKVVIRKSNFKPTKDGANGMLEFQMEIIEGQYTGRFLFWNLNLFHQSSQQAVEIAHKQLSAIGHVIGQYTVQDQAVADNVLPNFHNVPFFVHVVISQGNNGPINNIRGVKDINGNEPGKQGQGPQPPQGPAPGVAPAWGGQTMIAAPGGYQAPPPAAQPPGQPFAQPGMAPPPAQGPGVAPGPAPAPAWGGQPQGQPQPGPAPAAQPGQPQWGAPAMPPQGQPQQPQPPAAGGWSTGAPAQPPAQPGPAPGQQWQPQAPGGPQGPGVAPGSGAPWQR